MEIYTLKNGTEEAKPLVVVTMMSLRDLIQRNPIAYYELVEVCRDSTHTIWPGMDTVLRGLQLISSENQVHDSIRNIVLSSAEGEGANLVLGSPLMAR